MKFNFLFVICVLAFARPSFGADEPEWNWLLGCYYVTAESGKPVDPQDYKMATIKFGKSSSILQADKSPFDALLVSVPHHIPGITENIESEVVLGSASWVTPELFKVNYTGPVYFSDKVQNVTVYLKAAKQSDGDYEMTYARFFGTTNFWRLTMRQTACP